MLLNSTDNSYGLWLVYHKKIYGNRYDFFSYCGYLHTAIRYRRACKDLSTYSQDMTKRKIVKARGGFFYLRKKKYFLCYLRTWRLPVAESIPQQSDHIMIANRWAQIKKKCCSEYLTFVNMSELVLYVLENKLLG